MAACVTRSPCVNLCKLRFLEYQLLSIANKWIPNSVQSLVALPCANLVHNL